MRGGVARGFNQQVNDFPVCVKIARDRSHFKYLARSIPFSANVEKKKRQTNVENPISHFAANMTSGPIDYSRKAALDQRPYNKTKWKKEKSKVIAL